MGKVFLADNIFTGHHKIYLDTLKSIYNTENVSKELSFSNNKFSFDYYFCRRDFINLVYERSQKKSNSNEDIIHFLYLDNLYTNPSSLKKIKDFKIVGTLHHYPQNKIKMKLFKHFSEKLDKIVVHSEYIKQILSKENILNVEVIDYPSFYDYRSLPNKVKLKQEMMIPKDKIIISALGGTRYDKGLDLLLESFKLIPTKMKNRILLNIVGKEEDFSKEYIRERAIKYNIEYRTDLGYVNDKDFMSNVVVSDLIILPYRSIFTGNSGPMTEAIVNHIKVLGPSSGNIGYLIDKYNLGITFIQEDIVSLAKALIYFLENNSEVNSDFHQRVTIESFVRSYKDVYENL
jgi:glycosyltransferase involved in cell wall biosynthesis